MKGTVLVTGGTGLIGKSLVRKLKDSGYEVRTFTRNPRAEQAFHWDPVNGQMDAAALDGVDHIVHLAGAGIADSRWTEARKKLIIDSRILGPKLIHDHLTKSNQKIQSFISASGSSFYGVITSDQIFTENDGAGQDWVSDCVIQWEGAADLFAEVARVVKLRISLVLSMDGGAFPRLVKPIRMRAAAALGSGKHWMPWVHEQDVVDAFVFAIENQIEGAFNVAADNPVNNKEFTQITARALGRKVWLPNVPAWMLKLMFGDMSSLVLNGARLSNDKLKGAGFKFTFDNPRDAIHHLLEKQ